ncbi:hypothetical protein HDU91_002702, partial [Kappamyces sp. JEL0680]
HRRHRRHCHHGGHWQCYRCGISDSPRGRRLCLQVEHQAGKQEARAGREKSLAPAIVLDHI